jgi:hypothetical protein
MPVSSLLEVCMSLGYSSVVEHVFIMNEMLSSVPHTNKEVHPKEMSRNKDKDLCITIFIITFLNHENYKPCKCQRAKK